jgi:RNA recognition motif-containing protein
MNTKVYVENLAADTSAMDLTILFSTYGNVMNINLTKGRDSHRPSCSGVVTMVTPDGARAAIHGLNGKQWAARTLVVTEVRPSVAG